MANPDPADLLNPSKPLKKKPYSTLPALGADGVLHVRQKARTIQAGAENLNINRIVDRALRTGQLPIVNRPIQFGDATRIPDLAQALQAQATAKQLYASLPAQLRAETGNNPANLEAWLKDPRNKETGIKLGLFKTPPPEAPPVETPPAKPAAEPKTDPAKPS